MISRTATLLEQVMVTPSSPDTQIEWDRHFELYFNGKAKTDKNNFTQ